MVNRIKDKFPIVFIHYGDNFYLKYTLPVAVKFNPDREVILIGDRANKKYEKFGVKHYFFSEYFYGEKIEEFKSVFRFIRGNKFIGGEKWTRFNFYKMFVLENFWKKHNLNAVWLFDSDVLITEQLSFHEDKYLNYEYMYHGEFLVPQALINSYRFISNITQFFIDSFKDDNFIKQAQKDIQIEEKPQNGLTYMYFFKKYNEIVNQNIINYQTIINNETFDRCLFEQFKDGMTLYSIKTFQYKMKEIFFYPSGEIFTKKEIDNTFVKLITINLSWLPEFIVKRITQQALKYKGRKKRHYNFKKLKLMHLNPNNWIKWKRRILNKLKH